MTRRPRPTPRSLPKEVAELVAANSESQRKRWYAQATLHDQVHLLRYDHHVPAMTLAEVLEGAAARLRSEAEQAKRRGR